MIIFRLQYLKFFFTQLAVVFSLSLFNPVFSQDCPQADTVRYAATDFQSLGENYAIRTVRFNGNNCLFSLLKFKEEVYFDIFANGSALLHGTATTDDLCNQYDGEQWEIHISFVLTAASAPNNPIGNPDISLWKFFKILPASSYFKSLATGEIVTLTSGGPNAQLGQGANRKTAAFGLSASFFYQRSAGFFQSGELNIDLTPFECEEPEECELNFKTIGHGGWGARPSGNNPGKYLHSNFNNAFPNGLTVGCDKQLIFTNAQAITDFLPSTGRSKKLRSSETNPTRRLGVLAGHTVALAINLAMDEYDANFGPSNTLLASVYISEGIFQGWTVHEVFDEANKVLGGCQSGYAIDEVTTAISLINESFEDGNQSNNYLTCEPSADAVITEETSSEANNEEAIKVKVFPNPTANQAELSVYYEGERIPYTYTITDGYGNVVMTPNKSNLSAAETTLDLSALPPNRYIIRVESKKGIKNITLIKN